MSFLCVVFGLHCQFICLEKCLLIFSGNKIRARRRMEPFDWLFISKATCISTFHWITFLSRVATIFLELHVRTEIQSNFLYLFVIFAYIPCEQKNFYVNIYKCSLKCNIHWSDVIYIVNQCISSDFLWYVMGDKTRNNEWGHCQRTTTSFRTCR